MMDPEHRKLLEQEMVNFLFEGKEVHIEGIHRLQSRKFRISSACKK